MPLIIHTRKADNDCYEILRSVFKNNKSQKMHIHCFTDSVWFAETILKEFPNSFFGFTGVVTFSNNLVEVIKSVPIERILLGKTQNL